MHLKDLWQIIKEAGGGFSQHDGFKLSASLSFYTLLTVGPMMLIIFYITGLFWGSSAIEGTIYSQISGIVGEEAAAQLQELIRSASVEGSSVMAIIGVVALLVSATTVFTQLQYSMNTIWDLQVKTGSSWQQMLKNRGFAFIFVAGISILMSVLLLVNGVLESFMGKIQQLFPHIAFTIIYPLNLLMTLAVVALFFAFVYKVLPDAYIKWRDVAAGALTTGLLFMLGNFAMTIYFNAGSPASAYGSAGSLIVLLLWIYYSAIILFLGAEITKAYAIRYGSHIKPKEYAIEIKVIEAESGKQSGGTTPDTEQIAEQEEDSSSQ